jgi:FkbM family methyltransferase
MLRKIKKFLDLILLFNPKIIRALFCGVAAGIEHRNFLSQNNFETIIDIGANRGQFALMARVCCPIVKIISFEPLKFPIIKYKKIFKNDKNVSVHEIAIGATFSQMEMHISLKDHSSSLLPITNLQSKMFPGTEEISTQIVTVSPLDQYIKNSDLLGRVLLKIDVQGFEYDVLCGSEKLLSRIDAIYCECSFLELYGEQKLTGDIIEFLMLRNFYLAGVYNLSFDLLGSPIQADFFFKKRINHL